jgi:hypothetical protein
MYFSAEVFMMDFTSATAITGTYLANKKNNVKKSPIEPMYMEISTQVGEYMAHEDGK